MAVERLLCVRARRDHHVANGRLLVEERWREGRVTAGKVLLRGSLYDLLAASALTSLV